MRNAAIVLFDDVEVLDFAGPFEVFSVVARRARPEPFAVYTVAERDSGVVARNGLRITPHWSFANAPNPALLIVPGGTGTRREMKNPVMLEWLALQARECELLLSVCTGALVLGAAGLLDGLAATTHFEAMEELRAVAPTTDLLPDARVVDNGKVVLSAGVSAGIDMSLHVVARLLGAVVARDAARYMEYEGRWEEAVTSRR
jgi:transcriptional regulator GlxA family with amidase domain